MSTIVAVDLGATSGRVIAGRLEGGIVHHDVVSRFPNGPLEHADGLHWNVSGLFHSIQEGLRDSSRLHDDVVSIGVDSWAVDYGLLHKGQLLQEPFHYRDDRTASGVSAVHAQMPFDQLFLRNGLQFLPFNTVYQLASEDWSGPSGTADQLLLIPDLINYWLTEQSWMEETNASTTGLLDVETGLLADDMIRLSGAPRRLFPALIKPGDVVGTISQRVSDSLGLSGPVVAVGSHDTASAVLATPLNSPESAYISCGTWGLVGLELEKPIVSDAARGANFTNERGVDGRIRFLHNVMGLWLLNESVRHWHERGDTRSVEDLVAQAEHYDGVLSLFDVNDSVFMPPGNMPERISDWLVRHDQPVPPNEVAMVASIIESLARAFARAVEVAGELAGIQPRDISLVGGGSLNHLLCQRLADHAGVPVFAGPVEATALGNILVQARAAGLLEGDLESLRHVARASSSLRTFNPRGQKGTE